MSHRDLTVRIGAPASGWVIAASMAASSSSSKSLGRTACAGNPDDAWGRESPDGEEGAEAQVLGEDGLRVAVRLLQDFAVEGTGLADVHPMNSLMTCGCEGNGPPRSNPNVTGGDTVAQIVASDMN